MAKRLPPPDAESNIFDQFDVQVTGELLPGGASTVNGYLCRLPECRRKKKRVFNVRRGLIMHRVMGHSLKHRGALEIPEEEEILQWLRSGKPRQYEIPPYETPERAPELSKSPNCPAGTAETPGSSLLSKLLLCKPDIMESELQPASLESNIYEQFDVRHKPVEAGEPSYVVFVCLLSQCHERNACFNAYAKWTRHRRAVHKETEEVQRFTLPDVYEIREWVIQNKPRPCMVPVSLKVSKEKHGPVDPDVFAEFDVKGTVEDDIEQLQFLCLLDPCKKEGARFDGRRSWRRHRTAHHGSPNILPFKEMIKEWMIAGKPLHYEPQSRVRTTISVDPPSTETGPELPNREVNPTPSNVGNEVNGQKSQVLCPLPGGEESRKCRSANQHSQGHDQELHKRLSLEGCSSLRSIKSLARLGKFRPSTHPNEIPSETRRGGRPRNADAAGSSSDSEPAHPKKKKRHSIRSTESTGTDSSKLVALRLVASEEGPSGGLRKRFKEMMKSISDEAPPSDESDEESDDGTEDVDEKSDDGTEDADEESDDGSENGDDLSEDQTVEDPKHDHNSADMEEFGEEPHEDSARAEDALPSLQHSQKELLDSGAADVAEVDEDAHEEFEAPDNVLPSQPELQNAKVERNSSIQPQDFQGVLTDQHQQYSKMTDAGEEASEEFEAPDNVSQLELQNTKVVGHSSVQPQDFQGVTDKHGQQKSKMADADEEALEDSAASENVLPSLQISSTQDKPDCDAAEMGEGEEEEAEDFVSAENALTALTHSQLELWEHSSVQPKDFQGDGLQMLPSPKMDEVEEEELQKFLSSLPCLLPDFEFGVPGIVEHDNVLPQEFPGEKLEEAHEKSINPWNLNPSVPSDESDQIALSPLWNLDGDTIDCLPQDFPGENWPYLSKEDNLKYSAEMTQFGEKGPEEIVAAVNFSLSVQPKSSEQNALSTPGHYFRDASEFSPGETDNHRPNSDAEMTEVGEEAPERFVPPGKFVPWNPLMQLEGTKTVPSLKGPVVIQAAAFQEIVPRFSMDQVFIIGPNGAGMAEVGEETREGFVTPENLAPWNPLMQLEGTKLPSLEGPINIQESVPRVHVDIASMDEAVVIGPFAPATQPNGRGVGSIFMEGSAENSTENQVNPIQEHTIQGLSTLMHMESVLGESEPDPPLIAIDGRVANPEEYFRRGAVALSPQPMQQLLRPENSEDSYTFPVFPLAIDPLIDMDAGLEYELRMRLQGDEIPAWLLPTSKFL